MGVPGSAWEWSEVLGSRGEGSGRHGVLNGVPLACRIVAFAAFLGRGGVGMATPACPADPACQAWLAMLAWLGLVGSAIRI
jgi:hypothetical protein